MPTAVAIDDAVSRVASKQTSSEEQNFAIGQEALDLALTHSVYYPVRQGVVSLHLLATPKEKGVYCSAIFQRQTVAALTVPCMLPGGQLGSDGVLLAPLYVQVLRERPLLQDVKQQTSLLEGNKSVPSISLKPARS